MKAVVFLALCCLLGATLAQSFEGTWNDGKRNFGGSLYICVDQDRNVAHGSYSGAGLFTGLIRGNTINGQWYEAGYDRPFGPMTLTLAASGNSFSGSWSYSEATTNTTSNTFTWNGSRTSRARPTTEQCLVPSRGIPASGTFEKRQSVCVRLEQEDENTGQSAVFGQFSGFGAVEGFTYDFGRSTLLSDYIVRTNTNETYRPENNAATFGPCTGCNTQGNPALINTQRIVIGAAINDDTFCGFFWEGLYNRRVSDQAICFSRSSFEDPSDGACAVGAVQTTTGGGVAGNNDGNTLALINEIQRAFDALNLPQVVIVQGAIEDDDDDGIDNNGDDDDSNDDDNNGGGVDDDDLNGNVDDDDNNNADDDDNNGGSNDDDDNINYVPVPVPVPVPFPNPVPVPFPNPIPVPVPVPVPVLDDDDDNVTGSFTFSFGDSDSASGSASVALSALIVLAAVIVA